MKPTKKQARAEVLALSARVRELTNKQVEYCTSTIMFKEHTIYHLKGGRAWCSCCGEANFRVDTKADTAKCPKCGHTFRSVESTRTTHKGFGYCAVLSVVDDWQIVRYFCTECDSKKGKAGYWMNEVLRKWYNVRTKMVVTERCATKVFPTWLDQPYSMYAPLHIANQETHYGSEWFRHSTCPYGAIHKELRKKGFDIKAIREMDSVSKSFVLVGSIPMAETMLKRGQYQLVNYMDGYENKAKHFERQFVLALRHGFNFEKINLKDYIDYLEQCEQLHYDIHSPKWLCPANLDKEHARLNRLIERKEIEAKRKQYLSDYEKKAKKIESEYSARIQKYIGLLITNGTIEIRPLLSVREFVDEGAEMQHCVFWNGYYDEKRHPYSLILSARIDGERIETIEISTKDWRIVQSRGFQNSSTGHHNEIIKLMEKNMKTIKKMAMAS